MKNGEQNGPRVATVRMPPETHEIIRSLVYHRHTPSMNAFILEAIDEKLEREGDLTPGLPPGVDKEEAVV